ncbi:MAG TPA: AbrB/MazE/SpoVT family DNA-binding domain-containing protein [Jiangellaceae bacterium]|nr:AbrB/MazE/SpoVT family DNA-binding domain-containing protein [Jiangellaceae bacterium]
MVISCQRTTVDAAGRLVVPKELRVALGLEPGRAVDIVFTDGRLEIELAPVEAQVVREEGLPRITAVEQPPPLSDREIREAIESTRR